MKSVAGTALVVLALSFAACGDDSDSGSAPGTTDVAADSTFDHTQVAELESILNTAYEGASGYAETNDNFFARNSQEKGDLAAAVSVALSKLDNGVGSSYAEEEELGVCSRYGADAPFVAVNASPSGDGLTLTASDAEASVTLSYEPGSDIVVADPVECKPPG